MQIPSGEYLLARRQRAPPLRWAVVARRYIWDSRVAADLIVPGFMVTLMVHLAVTRLDGGTRREAFSPVCECVCVRARARQYGNILLKTDRVGR